MGREAEALPPAAVCSSLGGVACSSVTVLENAFCSDTSTCSVRSSGRTNPLVSMITFSGPFTSEWIRIIGIFAGALK